MLPSRQDALNAKRGACLRVAMATCSVGGSAQVAVVVVRVTDPGEFFLRKQTREKTVIAH